MRPYLIAVTGGSGSGKSTLARTLMAELPDGSTTCPCATTTG